MTKTVKHQLGYLNSLRYSGKLENNITFTLIYNRRIGLTDTLTDISKFSATSRSRGDLKFCILIGLGVWPTVKIEKPKTCLSKYRKKYRKIRAILYNTKTADRIEAEFSLKKRAEITENKSSWHHARWYHRFRDIRLQFS